MVKNGEESRESRETNPAGETYPAGESKSTREKREPGEQSTNSDSTDTTSTRRGIRGGNQSKRNDSDTQSKRNDSDTQIKESYRNQGIPKMASITSDEIETTKRVRKSKKKELVHYDSKQISNVIYTIFQIIGSKPEMEFWKLSMSECDSIAIPIVNLIEKSEKFELLKEHGDSIALVIAVFTIVMPRLFMQITIQKGKNIDGKNKSTAKVNIAKGKDNVVIRKSDTTDNNTTYATSFIDTLPSISTSIY